MKNLYFILTLLLVACSFSCEKILDGEAIWMERSETVCDNPWEPIEGKSNLVAKRIIREALADIDIYCYRIIVFEHSDYNENCIDCICPTGKTIRVLIWNDNAYLLEKMGFAAML